MCHIGPMRVDLCVYVDAFFSGRNLLQLKDGGGRKVKTEHVVRISVNEFLKLSVISSATEFPFCEPNSWKKPQIWSSFCSVHTMSLFFNWCWSPASAPFPFFLSSLGFIPKIVCFTVSDTSWFPCVLLYFLTIFPLMSQDIISGVRYLSVFSAISFLLALFFSVCFTLKVWNDFRYLMWGCY